MQRAANGGGAEGWLRVSELSIDNLVIDEVEATAHRADS